MGARGGFRVSPTHLMALGHPVLVLGGIGGRQLRCDLWPERGFGGGRRVNPGGENTLHPAGLVQACWARAMMNAPPNTQRAPTMPAGCRAWCQTTTPTTTATNGSTRVSTLA